MPTTMKQSSRTIFIETARNLGWEVIVQNGTVRVGRYGRENDATTVIAFNPDKNTEETARHSLNSVTAFFKTETGAFLPRVMDGGSDYKGITLADLLEDLERKAPPKVAAWEAKQRTEDEQRRSEEAEKVAEHYDEMTRRLQDQWVLTVEYLERTLGMTQEQAIAVADMIVKSEGTLQDLLVATGYRNNASRGYINNFDSEGRVTSWSAPRYRYEDGVQV